MLDDQLPSGWAQCSLGEYVYLKNGFAFKSKTYEPPGPHSVPVIRISDIDGEHASDLKASHVNEQEAVDGFEVKSGDLLIAMSGATTGKIGVYIGQQPAYQNQRVGNIKLHSNKLGSAAFRNHLISYLSRSILENAYGGAQPNISGKAIEDIEILLPPLAEQKEIAAKLDELLAQVDTIKTRLHAIRSILKRFRQSVLAAAVSGRLTEEWREVNGKVLDSWRYLKVGNIVENIEAGKNLKCIETPPADDEFGIIKISAVTWGIYNEEESKTLPDKNLFVETRRIHEGDFLISRANTIELLGNPVIVHKVNKNLMLSDKVLRLVMPEIDKPWVNLFLRSSEGRKQIETRSTGNQMSMRNIGQKALLDIDLPKPEPDEQSEIVRRVEQLFTFADQIEQRVKDAQSRVNHLSESILAKAFRGELTAKWRERHPDLISGENSAEALLERIGVQRKSTPLTTLKRKKRA